MALESCQRTPRPICTRATAIPFSLTILAALRTDEAIRCWGSGIAVWRMEGCVVRSWLAVDEGRRLHSRKPSNRPLPCQGQPQRSAFMRFSCRETITRSRLLTPGAGWHSWGDAGSGRMVRKSPEIPLPRGEGIHDPVNQFVGENHTRAP